MTSQEISSTEEAGMILSTTRYRALSLVPVAVLSGAWTFLLAGASTDPAPAPTAAVQVATEPSTPIPASTGAVTPASASRVVSATAVSTIPPVALAAYQRAASVIDSSDPGCGLGWELLAAIGRVETDHGRASLRGPVVTAGGLAVPDTDAGEYDGDALHDRGVGPMLLLPSAWSSVRVDGDGDGVRNPDDIDDAALASAVYLCSGGEDLATTAGRRAALVRYDPSSGYVEAVLGYAHDYAVASRITNTYSAFAASYVGAVKVHPTKHPKPVRHARPAKPGTRPTGTPTKPATPAPPAPPAPTDSPQAPALTRSQATWQCTVLGLREPMNTAEFRACVAERMQPPS